MAGQLVTVQALNVACQPPVRESYIRLFEALKGVSSGEPFWGERKGKLVDVVFDPVEQPTIIKGEILTYVGIDPGDNWINTRTNKPVSDEDRPYLGDSQPHGAYFSFHFDIETHLFVFETTDGPKKLTAELVQRLLLALLARTPLLFEELFEMNVTPIPDPATVGEILGSRLTRLEIRLLSPNVDPNSDVEEKYRKRMARRKVKIHDEAFSAKRGETIHLDQEMIEMVQVAATNGWVNAKAKAEKRKKKDLSTRSKPWEISEPHDTREPRLYAFARAARDAVNQFIQRRIDAASRRTGEAMVLQMLSDGASPSTTENTE